MRFSCAASTAVFFRSFRPLASGSPGFESTVCFRGFESFAPRFIAAGIAAALVCLAALGPAAAGEATLRAGGYVKHLNAAAYRDIDSLVTDNLVHHRLNLLASPVAGWEAAAELRTRLFYGEGTRATPGLGDALDEDPRALPLSATLWDTPAALLHTTLDRLWVNASGKRWDARLGRQRINWGIHALWNPNDLFNAYQFADFDYEERPGSDALRVQIYPRTLASIEVAVQPQAAWERTIAAVRAGFHLGSADYQVVAGRRRDELALGGGWAADLLGAGFKGEWTWFQPYGEFPPGRGAVSGALSLEYFFPHILYGQTGYLYQSAGWAAAPGDSMDLWRFEPSPKRLWPARHTLLLQASHQPHPLWQTALTLLASPGWPLVFLMPSVGYSIQADWELLCLGQFSFYSVGDEFANRGNAVFVRLKWSY